MTSRRPPCIQNKDKFTSKRPYSNVAEFLNVGFHIGQNHRPGMSENFVCVCRKLNFEEILTRVHGSFGEQNKVLESS